MFLAAGLCFCAWTDLRWGRVPNEALILLALAGVLARGMGFLTGALPFLLFGMCLFRFRAMGAGDGKLMAVIVGYLGIRGGFYAVALGFLVGALWSLWRFRAAWPCGRAVLLSAGVCPDSGAGPVFAAI